MEDGGGYGDCEGLWRVPLTQSPASFPLVPSFERKGCVISPSAYPLALATRPFPACGWSCCCVILSARLARASTDMARFGTDTVLAREHFGTRFGTRRGLCVAGLEPVERQPVRRAQLGNRQHTRGAISVRMAGVVRWVTTSPRDRTRVTATGRRGAAGYRRLEHGLAALAVQRFVAGKGARGAWPFVAQAAALMRTARRPLAADAKARMIGVVTACRLAGVATARELFLAAARAARGEVIRE